MILALLITLAVLAVLALGILVYFKFFALVYDKDGMVYQAQGGPHLCNPPHIEDDGPIDGGVTDNSDLNAPKSIESNQIISFDCRFSTMDIAKPGKLGNHIYQIHAKLENGAVRGMYQVRDTLLSGKPKIFGRGADSRRDLQPCTVQRPQLYRGGASG